jgi:serine/threonine protein kinase
MSEDFETFGKYRLTERLAFGGMAEVFLATAHGDAGFTKTVVIKRLHPRLNEDTEFVQMLIDEARITAQLSHSNICQVLDLGSVGGSYYLAMEFISGEDLRTLQDHCNRTRVAMPVGAAVYVLSEMLAALDFAHRKEGGDGHPLGIIHRDISPQNVLVSYEGEVKVIDFGIAKARSRLVQTEAGVIKGKFRYMSPEQASGGKVDHRTDVFAAGVVLYELLRGEPHSVDVADTEVLRRMRKAEFEPLRSFRRDIDPALERAVKRALSLKPGNRFDTAGDFRETLLGFLQQTGVHFSRSELADFMKRVFDADRRRRRSGSFSGVRQQSPRSAEMGTPAHIDVYRESMGVASEMDQQDVQRLDSGEVSIDQRESWVAFAPTHAKASDQDYAYPPSPGAADPLEALPTSDLKAEDLGPGDDEKTKAFYSLEEEPSVPTTPVNRQSVGEVARPRSRSTGRATVQGKKRARGARQPSQPDGVLHQAPTDIRGQRAREPYPADPPSHAEPEAPPQEATNFFSRQAEVVEQQPRYQEVEPPRGRINRLMGVVAMVVLVTAFAVALYLMDQPLDLEEDLDQGAHRVSYLPDTASPPDAARQVADRGGMIRIHSSPPGAQVELCGEKTGERTPVELQGEVDRTCTLELVLAGHETYQLTVTPLPNKPINIVATLRRKRSVSSGGGHKRRPRRGRGTLRVTSIHAGQVYVDNKPLGRTPLANIQLRPGTYAVKVFFGGQDRTSRVRTVKIRAGETTGLHIDASP